MISDEIKALAASRALEIVQWLFPDGRREKAEWRVGHPGEPLQLSINVGLKPGQWQDLAGTASNGSLAALYSYAFGTDAAQATQALADFLGVAWDRPAPPPELEPEPELDPVEIEADMAAARTQRPTRQTTGLASDMGLRLLPSAPEAEKGLLSCLIQAADQIGAHCMKNALAARHFHHPAHAEIYRVIIGFCAEKKPCDVVVLMTAFHDAGRLEAVGGAAYLSELFSFAPSLHMAQAYIDLVLEKAAARELIATAAEFAERAYTLNSADDVRQLTQEFQERAGATAHFGATSDRAEELLRPRRFDILNSPPTATPRFKIGDAVIATPGNLVGIQAQAKAGKTALLGAMYAATMEPTGDCFTITSDNLAGRALIHFDTEQSPYDHHMCLLTALRRAGKTMPPDWLRSYRIADVAFRDRRPLIAAELQRAMKDCGGIHGVVLDGGADFIADPNHSEEAFGFVDEMHQLAIRYATVIVIVIHENPVSAREASGKTRGHLGSQLERKAETNLRLVKANGITTIFSERSRHANIPQDLGPRFVWDDEHRMHITTNSVAAMKMNARQEEHIETAKAIFQGVPDSIGMTYTQTLEELEKAENIKRDAAKKRLRAMVKYSVVRKGGPTGEKYFKV